MNRRHLGLTAPQFIVALVVVVVVAGVVLYFTSDVFRTKMDAQYDQLAHWTPENIAKDPENYLNFCETQTNKALQGLKANEISIAQSRGKLETMKEEANKKIEGGTPLFEELKGLYQKADAAKSWPLTWQGKSMDQNMAKLQIKTFFKDLESQKNLLNKVEAGLKNLDAQILRIQDTKSKAQGQLAEIKTSREMLKVQKITDDLTNRLVSMKGVLQATISTASDTSSGVMTLDQLVEKSTPTVSDTEFDKIMGGSTTSKP